MTDVTSTARSLNDGAVEAADRWVAVHLDGLGVQCVHDRAPEPWVGQLPPAALVPFWEGEPVRADTDLPAHLRGTALTWPPEARCSEREGGGRLPVALAWDLLTAGRSHEWRTEGRVQTLDPAEAIAATVSGVVRRASTPRKRPLVVLTIPNSLPEDHQEQLLESARRQGIELKLLWRPVAAALAWIGCYEEQLLRASDLPQATSQAKDEDVPLGNLAALHLGVEAPEVALLALVARRAGPDGAWRVLPGRRRPGPALPTRCGLESLAVLARWLAGQDREPGDSSQRQWRSLWASNRTVEALGHLRNRVAPPQLAGAWERPHARLVERLVESLAPALRAERSRTNAKEAPRGLVVTGALAGVRSAGSSLAQAVALGLGLPAGRLLVDGVENGWGLCASGSARFAASLEAQEVAYLDTLPQLRIAALRRGEPVWEPLFNSGDRWVPGGRRWRRDPPFGGLSLRRGQQVLDLTLHHEEHTTVRAVQVDLPTAVQEPLPVELDVTVEPAQGRARIQVISNRMGALGRRPVWAELARMRDTGHDPDTYLQENYPRAFPPLHPRMGSRERWRAVQPIIRDCLHDIPVTGPLSEAAFGRLGALGDALLQREAGFLDRSTGCREAAAVSSVGVPAGGMASGGDLASLVERLLHRLQRARHGDREWRSLVRVLGYTATPSPAFEDYLVARLRAERHNAKPEIVRACGWCLRSPDAVHLFVDTLLTRLELRVGGPTDWLRALSQMLRFREDATREVPTADATRLCTFLRDVFNAEVETGKGNETFRVTCLSVVYLLRRRAFDDQFLSPEEPLAIQLKTAFQRAVVLHAQRKLTLRGGTIDLAQELARLIDYVDRRGHGLPGIGVD